MKDRVNKARGRLKSVQTTFSFMFQVNKYLSNISLYLCRYRQYCSQYFLSDAVKRQAAQKVGEMFNLFVARHDRALEDADFVFGAQ